MPLLLLAIIIVGSLTYASHKQNRLLEDIAIQFDLEESII